MSQRAGDLHLPEQRDNAAPFPRAGNAEAAQGDQDGLCCAGDEQLQKRKTPQVAGAAVNVSNVTGFVVLINGKDGCPRPGHEKQRGANHNADDVKNCRHEFTDGDFAQFGLYNTITLCGEGGQSA